MASFNKALLHLFQNHGGDLLGIERFLLLANGHLNGGHVSFLGHFKWSVFHILLHSLIFKVVGNQTSACSLPNERSLSHQPITGSARALSAPTQDSAHKSSTNSSPIHRTSSAGQEKQSRASSLRSTAALTPSQRSRPSTPQSQSRNSRACLLAATRLLCTLSLYSLKLHQHGGALPYPSNNTHTLATGANICIVARRVFVRRAHNTIVVISRLRLLIVVGNNLHKTMHLRRHCLVVGTAPAKDGLASNTVFSGLIVAWFFAESPMRRSPEPASHATYDGVIRLPWSFGRISTRPFFYTPTQEYGSLTTVNYIINLFDNIV